MSFRGTRVADEIAVFDETIYGLLKESWVVDCDFPHRLSAEFRPLLLIFSFAVLACESPLWPGFSVTSKDSTATTAIKSDVAANVAPLDAVIDADPDKRQPPPASEEAGASADRDTVERLTDKPGERGMVDVHKARNGWPALAPGADRAVVDAFAGAALAATGHPRNPHVRGIVRFISEVDAGQTGSSILVTLRVADATPGEHAVHVEQAGECKKFDDYRASHWNPGGTRHGFPSSGEHHLGDLGNLKVGPEGAGEATFRMRFVSDRSGDARVALLGKAVVLTERGDDFVTQPSGNSGRAIACGIIEKTDLIAH